MKTLLHNTLAVTPEEEFRAAVIIDGERISQIWREQGGNYVRNGESRTLEALAEDCCAIDLGGKTLMAGVIDAHVHFREPGMEHKADIGTESRAALMGGVTSYIDMPNNKPPTTCETALNDKLNRASGRSYANYGFHIGLTNENIDEIRSILERGGERPFGGVKVFMGSSTGNMLVDKGEALRAAFSLKGVPVLVHCEDEEMIEGNLMFAKTRFPEGEMPYSVHSEIRNNKACLVSTFKAYQLAAECRTRLHVLHVSTSEELELIGFAKEQGLPISCETSANYLWFSNEDYGKMGPLLKCNPAVKSPEDRERLRMAMLQGEIDTIGSDHAPHLLSEKRQPYLSCPSGLPTIGESLSAVLTVASEIGLPLREVSRMMSAKPAELFGIQDRGKIEEGAYADLVVIDTAAERIVEGSMSKCGWTPYEGCTLKGRVTDVYLNGTLAVKDGEICTPPSGKRLIFN